MRRRHWAWVYLTAASTHATSRQQKHAPVTTRTSSRAPASIPGGSPTAAAVLPKSICFAKLLTKSAIGEVGLDFSARFAGSEPLQIQALDRLCDALVQYPLAGRVISIHAVRSAGTVLDALESYGLLTPSPNSPAIIFHWFSGTSDELVRARDAGCYFSVSERMLATKRGREYARQIPLDRLLFETDAPAEPQADTSARQLIASLKSVSRRIAELKNCAVESVESIALGNSHSIFDFR